MKRSGERILTTHVGSLPRPKDVANLIFAKEREEEYDQPALHVGDAGADRARGVVGVLPKALKRVRGLEDCVVVTDQEEARRTEGTSRGCAPREHDGSGAHAAASRVLELGTGPDLDREAQLAERRRQGLGEGFEPGRVPGARVRVDPAGEPLDHLGPAGLEAGVDSAVLGVQIRGF